MSTSLTTATLLGSAEWKTPEGLRTGELTRALLSERIYCGHPVRAGHAYPRQRNYHGHYFVASTGAHAWHESLLERHVLRLLDHAGDLTAVATQPMKLRVGERVHTPDILVRHSDGSQTLIDVKPSTRVDQRAREQFDATAAVCRQVGWNYRVLTERRPQVRVNLQYLSEFRRAECSLDDVSELIDRYRDGWTVADVVHAMPGRSMAESRAFAMNVLWNRDLVVDLGQRLTKDSPVTRPTEFGLEAVDAIL